MKRLNFILLASICFLVISCDNKDGSVSMRVSPQTVSMTDSSMKLIIENHTRRPLEYGAPFGLQYFNNGNWETIEFDFEWILPVWVLKAGGTAERQISLSENGIHFAKPGKYRIVKNIALLELSSDSFKLKAEFEVVK